MTLPGKLFHPTTVQLMGAGMSRKRVVLMLRWTLFAALLGLGAAGVKLRKYA